MLGNSTNFGKVRIQQVEKCPLCESTERVIFEHDAIPDKEIHLLKCSDCGLLYSSGAVVPEDTAKLYDAYNKERNANSPGLQEKRAVMHQLDRHYASRFLPEGEIRILDIGCAEGDFLQLFGAQAHKYGIEADAMALREGRKKYPKTTFYDSLDSVSEKERFDAIIFRGALQYMTDLKKVSSFCAARLVPGGKVFLLATPNADSILAQLQKEHWVLADKMEHRYCFGIEQIRRLFGPAFTILHYDFPYLETPYANYPEDLRKLLNICKDKSGLTEKFPFFGSMLNMVLVKNA